MGPITLLVGRLDDGHDRKCCRHSYWPLVLLSPSCPTSVKPIVTPSSLDIKVCVPNIPYLIIIVWLIFVKVDSVFDLAAFDEYYTETDEGPTGPPVDFSSLDQQNNGESFVYSLPYKFDCSVDE